MEKKNKEANIKLKKKNQEVVDLNEEKEAALTSFTESLNHCIKTKDHYILREFNMSLCHFLKSKV